MKRINAVVLVSILLFAVVSGIVTHESIHAFYSKTRGYTVKETCFLGYTPSESRGFLFGGGGWVVVSNDVTTSEEIIASAIGLVVIVLMGFLMSISYIKFEEKLIEETNKKNKEWK